LDREADLAHGQQLRAEYIERQARAAKAAYTRPADAEPADAEPAAEPPRLPPEPRRIRGCPPPEWNRARGCYGPSWCYGPRATLETINRGIAFLKERGIRYDF
jgi:hypothetical protein